MSEAGMITSNPLTGERRGGTVGFPLPGISVRVVDQHDQPTPSGEPGAIQVKGHNVFAGYWRNPSKTREEFTADGWFRTGDIGVIDGDGYLSIVGRAKDLIITGGYNVYPKEVELVIEAMPGVVESAVVGVPHPDFGEAVTAAVVFDRNREPPNEDPTGQLQGAQTRAFSRRPSAQCHGEGAEEPAAPAARRTAQAAKRQQPAGVSASNPQRCAARIDWGLHERHEHLCRQREQYDGKDAP
jgi:acyl-CoA synthetase (AMP-forming)/AMP-acid ligase II